MNRREFLKNGLVFTASAGTLLTGLESFAEEKPALPKQPKRIFLTIDDGPSYYTEQILRNLNGENAIFYFIGKQLKTQREKAYKVLEAGSIIGNHSYTHPDFKRVSFASAKEQFEKTEELIEEAYAHLGIRRIRKFFRFPYGSSRADIKEFIKSQESEIQFWDIDTLDWRYYSKKSPLSVDEIMYNCSEAQDGDIVLVHERGFTTAQIIPFYVNSRKYDLAIPFMAQDKMPELY